MLRRVPEKTPALAICVLPARNSKTTAAPSTHSNRSFLRRHRFLRQVQVVCRRDETLRLETSVWLEFVNVQLTGRGRRSGSGVISTRAHVDLSVGYRGHRELDGEAGRIGRYLPAIPQFGSEIGGIKGV